MPYAHITFAGLQTEVATRLDDPSNIFWSAAEIQAYILESLRTWQAFSHYWRDRMTFNTVAGQTFYDLTQQAQSLLPFTIKDSDLVSTILYHMVEPQLAGGLYVGTDMFSLADFTKALERRRNQFLSEAGMVLTRSTIAWAGPPAPRSALDDRTIAVRRAAWIDGPSGIYTPLYRSDEWAASAFSHGWENSVGATPLAYSVAAAPVVTIQLIPPPAEIGGNGTLELLSIFTGLTLNPAAGVLLGIPDDFAWVIKWGAMADLLAKSGQAHDMARSAYCEQRYKEGIALALMHTSALQGYINGTETQIQAVNSLDTFNPNWENTSAIQQLAADSFVRADGPVTLPWRIINNNVGFGDVPGQILNNKFTTQTVHESEIFYDGGIIFPPNQFSKARLTALSSTAAAGLGGLLLRGSPTSLNCIEVLIRTQTGGGFGSLADVNYNNLGGTTGLNIGTITPQLNDMFMATIIENVLKLYQNNVLVITYQIPALSITSGSPGLVVSLSGGSPPGDTSWDNWSGGAANSTDTLALASWNMLAVTPRPAVNALVPVVLDVVRNAPVPAAGGDQIQIGREELDAVIDYCEHLAMFKKGGSEFMETMPLYQNMQRLAAMYNETLKAQVNSVEPIGDRSIRDEKLVPRRGDILGKG